MKDVKRRNHSSGSADADSAIQSFTVDQSARIAAIQSRTEKKKRRQKMNRDELKNSIEQRVGIPAELLTGEHEDEIIAQAKQLLDLKDEEKENSKEGQFEKWFLAISGQEESNVAAEELEAIANEVRVSLGGYPIVKDGGQIDTSNMPDTRPAKEQFEEWFRKQSAFNPSKGEDGWIKY